MNAYRLPPAAALTVLALCTACTASTPAGPTTATSAPAVSSSPTSTTSASTSVAASVTAGPALSAADYDPVLPDLSVLGSDVTPSPDADSAKASLLQIITGYPDSPGTKVTPGGCAAVVNPFADVTDTKAKIAVQADPKAEYFVVVGAPGATIATIRQQVTDCASTTITSNDDDALATIAYTPDFVLTVPAAGDVPLVNMTLTSSTSGNLNLQVAVAEVRGVAVLVGVSSTTALNDDLRVPVQGLVQSAIRNILAR